MHRKERKREEFKRKQKRGESMNRYQFNQSLILTEENNFIEKECHLSLLVNEKGIRRRTIVQLLEKVSKAYGVILLEERKQAKRERTKTAGSKKKKKDVPKLFLCQGERGE